MGADGDWLDPRSWGQPEAPARELLAEQSREACRAARRKAGGRAIRNLASRQMAQLVMTALEGGAVQRHTGRFEWDCSKGCQMAFVQQVFTTGVGGTVDILCPCRQCEVCLRNRRALWSARARDEARAAARTWFGTLTLTPEWQYRALCVSSERRRAAGADPSELTPGQEFADRCAVIGDELTKWLKRLRKRCVEEWEFQGLPSGGDTLRYLLVAEEHKSGDPHWHLLVHEQSVLKPIRSDWLTKAPREIVEGKPKPSQVDARWGLGFSHWELVDLDRVTYVTKYLSKSLLARVRASKRYGEHAALAHPEGVLDLPSLAGALQREKGN